MEDLTRNKIVAYGKELPWNHTQSKIYGLNQWRIDVQGCIVVKFKKNISSKRIARYLIHTRDGNMLKFLHLTSLAFDELEYELSVKCKHERSRYYVKGGNVIPMS